jgi:mRNA interferase MazF
MNPGDIVLTIIPQDGQQKRRPVLILKRLPVYNDLLVCAISSRLHQYVDGLDVIIQENSESFANSGLTKTSVVRSSNIATLTEEDIEGELGTLTPELFHRVINNLTTFLNDGLS